jgi:hypothetical protein
VQYCVNHEYVVLGINNRGSSGYGKTFLAADDKGPLWYCVDAKKIRREPAVRRSEPRRDYGRQLCGHMVVAALAFEPDVFDVGVDMFGVTN